MRESPPPAPSPGNTPSTRLAWGFLILVLTGIIVAFAWQRLRNSPAFGQPPVLGQLPEFELVERTARPFGSKQLAGKVWIADFIFTRCMGPCPRMSWNMQQLQGSLRDVDDVRLVTFTVDPEYDTPWVLTDYAQRYQAITDRWLFLTGNVDAIYKLAQENFRVTAKRQLAGPSHEIDHGTHFILVDAKGRIRGYYASEEDRVLELVAGDARRLLFWQRALPTLNAILNAASTCLLLAAYRAVRGRRLMLHRNLMFAAIGTSAAFLTSYLIYHFGVQLTRSYEGPWRELYLGILLSHTALAIGVLPLVLVTVARALKAQQGDAALASPEVAARFARHRSIARWTFPIWLYVSITGVIVYLMLYQLPRISG